MSTTALPTRTQRRQAWARLIVVVAALTLIGLVALPLAAPAGEPVFVDLLDGEGPVTTLRLPAGDAELAALAAAADGRPHTLVLRCGDRSLVVRGAMLSVARREP